MTTICCILGIAAVLVLVVAYSLIVMAGKGEKE